MVKLANAKYYIKEGVNGFFTNGMMSVASVVIVAACLLILGLYIMLSQNVNYMSSQLMSMYEIQVFIDRTATSNNVQQLGQRLSSLDNVSSITFISKNDTLDEVRDMFAKGSKALEGLENDNPFHDSYIVTMRDLDKMDATLRDIQDLPLVERVTNNKETYDALTRITDIVRNVSFWLMVLFGVVAVFIISNTIRLTLANRELEINIMKYLGATDFFIRTPFVIESLLISAIAVIVTQLLLWQVYALFSGAYGGILGSDVKILSYDELRLTLTLWLCVAGVVLSAVGAAISIRKYLRV